MPGKSQKKRRGGGGPHKKRGGSLLAHTVLTGSSGDSLITGGEGKQSKTEEKDIIRRPKVPPRRPDISMGIGELRECQDVAARSGFSSRLDGRVLEGEGEGAKEVRRACLGQT